MVPSKTWSATIFPLSKVDTRLLDSLLQEMTRRSLLSVLLAVCGFKISLIFLLRMKNSGTSINSKRRDFDNKRQRTSEAKNDMLNTIAKKVMTSQSRSKTSQLKVLVLAYGRTGSSFTGDLISADPTSAYFFEPFWNRSSLTPTNSTEGILNTE